MNHIAVLLLAAILFIPIPARAVIIEIVEFRDDFLEAILTEIDPVEDRVYVLDVESGEIRFGDGASGARPPSGGTGLIASYRTGSGSGGNIVNEYNVINVEFPLLIPLSDFLDAGSADRSVEFVAVGVSSLNLELTDNGLLITHAKPSTRIPEPTTLSLFGIGLAGLVFTRRRLTANARR